jgi:hypothetical protein
MIIIGYQHTMNNRLLSLLTLFLICSAKCGINYDYYEHKSIEQDDHTTYGYGFESKYLSNNRFCNDIEMLEQCDDATNIVNAFVDRLYIYNLFNNLTHKSMSDQNLIKCHNSIACYYDGIALGDFWCENMDLYDKCVMIGERFNQYYDSLTDHVLSKPLIECMNNNDLDRMILFRLNGTVLSHGIDHASIGVGLTIGPVHSVIIPAMLLIYYFITST